MKIELVKGSCSKQVLSSKCSGTYLARVLDVVRFSHHYSIANGTPSFSLVVVILGGELLEFLISRNEFEQFSAFWEVMFDKDTHESWAIS